MMEGRRLVGTADVLRVLRRSTAARQQVRTTIRGILELIADLDAQDSYERQVPIANVPAELISQWFDDHYHPGAEWFSEAFSERELASFADFNAFYEARMARLPLDGGVAKLRGSQDWIDVCEKARATLADLRWDS